MQGQDGEDKGELQRFANGIRVDKEHTFDTALRTRSAVIWGWEVWDVPSFFQLSFALTCPVSEPTLHSAITLQKSQRCVRTPAAVGEISLVPRTLEHWQR